METTNKKVLIVEDTQDYIWLLRQGFEKEGFKMSYAQDGQEGLKMAEQEHPDLMLIDIGLPKMDGIEMAKQIKAKGINCKMIFLTNVKDIDRVSQVMELAVDADYIVKADMHISDVVARVKAKLAG